MLNELLFLVYALVLGMMAVKNVPSKSTPWLVAYAAFLVGCGVLGVAGVFGGNEVCQYVFVGLAGASALVAVVRAATATGALPVLTNLMTYGKLLVKNLLFWPVLDFEAVFALFNK
jgi:hypothetical protein